MPGRIVKMGDQKIPRTEMDHVHLPDPVLSDIRELQNENVQLQCRIRELEEKLETTLAECG